jgi:two-component system, NtrC family, response regulator HydG
MHEASILIVDDHPGVLSAGKLFLKRHFAQVETAREPEALPDLLRQFRPAAVLLDMNFHRSKHTGQEGLDWLRRIKSIAPDTVVVLVTAYGDVPLAVQAIRAGAADFVLKPWDNDKLLATLHAALQSRPSEAATPVPAASANHQTGIVWRSQAMRQVIDTVERIANTDANVLVLGENGTGKDLVAQAIHARSARAERPLVKVDLGAISESLFESELFGHVKGAFTDAREAREGRFEAAHGGVIFLDEIGNIPLPLQAKLLTVLQNRTIVRVGANQSQPIDVRVVAATNQDLYAAVAARTFRQDLLYRINTIEIQIPALRERIDDIEPLARHFLREFAQKYQRDVQDIDPDALHDLVRYAWPGNVRELRHTLERAVILAQGSSLMRSDLLLKTTGTAPFAHPTTTSLSLEETEKNMVLQALEKHHGNITDAARSLGLTRASLYRRLEKFKL